MGDKEAEQDEMKEERHDLEDEDQEEEDDAEEWLLRLLNECYTSIWARSKISLLTYTGSHSFV